MKEALSERDRKRLEICENTIRNGLQSCFDTGAALLEIRDFKLYREECDSFEDYCQKHFQIGQRHANRLIASSDVKESVGHSKIGETVTNEAQARALSKVPETERIAVLKAAKKIDPNVTAAAILEVVQSGIPGPIGLDSEPIKTGISQKTASEIPIQLDGDGFKIPEACLEYWNRGSEIQELLTTLSRVKSKLEKKRDEDDPLYRNISQGAINEIALAYSFVANAKPYAVCLYCQGRLKDSCRGCKGTGFMAKFAYEHDQMKGARDIRKAAMKKASQ